MWKHLIEVTILSNRLVISLFRIVTDIAHKALIEEVVGIGGLVVGVSFDVHLIAQLLDPALEWIVGRELATVPVGRLDVLHVLFGLDLDDGGLPEDHYLNMNMHSSLYFDKYN